MMAAQLIAHSDNQNISTIIIEIVEYCCDLLELCEIPRDINQASKLESVTFESGLCNVVPNAVLLQMLSQSLTEIVSFAIQVWI